MLQEKQIVIGVCGGIAAYKVCDLVRMLKKAGAQCFCMMTSSAQEFITPLTLSTLTGQKTVCGMFEQNKDWEVEHISWAKRADVLVLVPATANVIGKINAGIADDFVTTTVMATKAPVLIAPAMNTNMFENPITQRNIAQLSELGYHFTMPDEGFLACGDTGRGRLAETERIFEDIVRLCTPQDLAGKSVLVTAGPTREAVDPVRFLTNHSTGKMGYAIARAAARRGAEVTLVSGPVSLPAPYGVRVEQVESACQMRDAVIQSAPKMDLIIKSAAVADFRPAHVADQKLKKNQLPEIQLEKNPDILQELGQMKLSAVLVGFAMETEDLEQRAKEKMERKGLHMIVANNLKVEGAGFGTDTNVVTVFSKDGSVKRFPKLEKTALADEILTMAKEWIVR
ncbi:MAG: bifunctional phosphopantothenoylcysteine decarboxylase/phosphopantothenate--cysteine ligase CoaBC [Ruminococcaceae bacterium]|nr:bifunctional phosphopantothenoylcysteine decarboxylase/phosphopantothenate--cysteine ligase CoaBC [Oscillospiraceae bacterium]